MSVQQLQQQTGTAPPCTSEQLPPRGETSSEEEEEEERALDEISQAGSAGVAAQDSSMAEGVAEGVAGLLAMTSAGDSKELVCTLT